MAVQEPIQWREPSQFAVGDTLKFQRNFPDFLPSDGWSVTLTVTSQQGQQIAQVQSGPDATNNFHTFNVPNFLAGAQPGLYILSEELICAAGGVDPGEEHQVYYDDQFNVTPNLGLGAAPGPILTEAQQKLADLGATYDILSKKILDEQDVQRNRFLVRKQKDVLDQIKYWKEVRAAEVQNENAKNGRQPGNTIQPIFNIGF